MLEEQLNTSELLILEVNGIEGLLEFWGVK